MTGNPKGIAFTPDGKTLLVTKNDDQRGRVKATVDIPMRMDCALGFNRSCVDNGGKLKVLALFTFLGLVLYSTLSYPVAHEGAEPFLTIDLKDNELILNAKEISLGQVINSIEREISIEIRGLENRLDQLVTFSGSGSSPDMLLRKLWRNLGEKNYAYEYDDDRLIKVTVFPPGRTSSTKDHLPDSTLGNRLISVVEVIGVVEDTQAARLGLKTGDYILKYDGVRIFQYDDLIEESTKDIGPRPVQMIVLRKGRLMSFYLERDFIGVRVRVKRIPMNALPADLGSW